MFARTNEAFAKLPAGTIDTLLKPEDKKSLAGVRCLVSCRSSAYFYSR